MIRPVSLAVLTATLFMAGPLAPRLNAQAPAQPTLAQQTQAGFDKLQSWYTPSTGLYQTNDWWTSANELTALADYSLVTHSSSYTSIFANTLQQAPNQFAGFLDNYYDDEGWWALAWIAAYDLTKNQQYLNTAGSIFHDMTGGWDSTCGGGIWWSKDRNYKNAIANELFLSVAAHLANRAATSDRPAYLSWANQEWTWFQQSGMINGQNLINDGLNSSCKNNGEAIWSYNQGVVLGGLVELNQAQPAPQLLVTANTIAQAAINHLSDRNGVLHDPGEPNLGADGVQFKGVFLRNLMALTAATPNLQYANFALTNAESIWYTSRDASNAFGQVWSGPFDAENSATQGSALDAFVAALAGSQNASLNAAPNFTLTAAPAAFQLVPGGSATSTVTLMPTNGFSSAVDLTATVVGAPAGVSAALDSSTLTGGGQATLNITTTAATPGGNFVIAVTGAGGGLMHTAYVQLALPDFSLSATPPSLYVNQSNSTSGVIAVNAINGFAGSVALSLSSVPPMVSASLSPVATATTSKLTLTAGVTAPTSSGSAFAISGTSGVTTRTVPSLSVAVSAGLGDCGLGTLVNLAGSYNVAAIRSDDTPFTDGGIDGAGYAYSAALLTNARVLNGIRFHLGGPNVLDAIYAAGQTIALPQGRYRTLQLLATGLEGNQGNQPISVTYTDGTTAQLTASFSDWFTPSVNANEGEAVAMPYRNTSSGVPDNRPFNLYGYTLLLDSNKSVKSMTLPRNRDIVVLAATLSDLLLGEEADLSRAYNAIGIYPDGATFPANGGVDAGGEAFSANLLNDLAATGTEIAVGPSRFHLAGNSVPDVVYGAGQTIGLPLGFYADLKLLGTAVQGNQADQTITVHYYDGSSDTFHQSFSDWSSLAGYPNESLAIETAYRDNNVGANGGASFKLYLYTLKLHPFKLVKSITLPNNRNVVLLSITLAPPSVVDLEPVVCPILGGFSK